MDPTFSYTPTWIIEVEPQTSVEEDKPITTCLSTFQRQSTSVVDGFSTYQRLVGVLGRVILYTRKWQMARSPNVKYNISLNDCIVSARTAAILLFQAAAYPHEIEQTSTHFWIVME